MTVGPHQAGQTVWRSTPAILAAAFLLAGCASLQTSAIGQAGQSSAPGQGLIAYALPRALLSAELIMIGDGYELNISRPMLEPDSRYRLLLSGRTSITSSDHFVAKVSPSTGLLESVDVTTEDKTGEILKSLAEAAGAMGHPPGVRSSAGRGSNGTLLARVIFDPLDPASVAAAETELRSSMKRYAAFTGAPFTEPAERMIEILPVSSTFAPAVGEPIPSAEAVAAACRNVVCAPTYTTVRIRARAPDGPAVENIARVPDVRRLARIDFRRSVFVTRQTQATFTAGMSSSTTLDKPSEAAAFALLPIEIIRTGLNAASEIVQLKIDLGAKQDDLAAAEAARAAARKPPAGETETSGRAGVGGDDSESLVSSRSFSAEGTSRVGGMPR